MLITSARCSPRPTACRRGSPTRGSRSSSQTLPSSSVASGATPRYLPPEAAPLPAMVEATWVPWPTVSPASASSVKLRASATWPARSGWVASTPVSSTATVTPAPVEPGRPGGRRADLRHAVVEGDPALAVQPDPLDAPRRVEPGPGGTGGDRLPDRAEGGLVAVQGGTANHRQVAGHPRAGQSGRGTPGGTRRAVRHQQRQGVAVGVVVTRLDQPGDVEESPVHPARAQQRQRVRRCHSEATAVALDQELHVLAAGAGPDRGAGGGDGDPVTGPTLNATAPLPDRWHPTSPRSSSRCCSLSNCSRNWRSQ